MEAENLGLGTFVLIAANASAQNACVPAQVTHVCPWFPQLSLQPKNQIYWPTRQLESPGVSYRALTFASCKSHVSQWCYLSQRKIYTRMREITRLRLCQLNSHSLVNDPTLGCLLPALFLTSHLPYHFSCSCSYDLSSPMYFLI